MASSNEGDLRFGADVHAQLLDWWRTTGLAELRAKYGADANIFFAVLDPAMSGLWDHDEPLGQLLHELDTAPDGSTADSNDYTYGVTGLMANVEGKLRFVLRTRLNSVEAGSRPDLVEPGDFPFEGAGFYRGYPGGVSGLAAEDDWAVYCWIVDKLIELRGAAAQLAIAACKNRAPGAGPEVKYLTGRWEPDGDGKPQLRTSSPEDAGTGGEELVLTRIAGGVGDEPLGHAHSK